MLALAPQILCGLGEEGGEPIFATSSRLKDLSASPRLRPSTYKDLAAIRGVLDEQAAAWNRGDIDAYMAGYAQSDDTMFVGTDVTRGWTKVRTATKRSTTRARRWARSSSPISIYDRSAAATSSSPAPGS